MPRSGVHKAQSAELEQIDIVLNAAHSYDLGSVQQVSPTSSTGVYVAANLFQSHFHRGSSLESGLVIENFTG